MQQGHCPVTTTQEYPGSSLEICKSLNSFSVWVLFDPPVPKIRCRLINRKYTKMEVLLALF